jgi:hypothetical protein
MTEQISMLFPNLYAVGMYIQDNVLNGYRLKDGYPTTYGWQYEVVMELNIDETPPVVEARKPGRPKQSS